MNNTFDFKIIEKNINLTQLKSNVVKLIFF